jgi:hypothetical protein
MRATGAIGAAQGGRARRSPRCDASGRGGMVRGGAGGRVERRRDLGAMARRVEVDLSPRAVEAVAQRVAQLIRAHEVQRQPELLTAGELARELRVERSWVYKHAHLLGGERIGDGPKAQWRFDLTMAKRGLARQRLRHEMTGA